MYIYTREVYSLYISLEKKKSDVFCINNHLLFQFHSQEFEYLTKTFRSLEMQASRKQAMRTLLWSSFPTDRCHGKSVERISSRAEGPDRLYSEAFGPLLRNAQPPYRDICLLCWFSIPDLISTNSSCSSSFQLSLLENSPSIALEKSIWQSYCSYLSLEKSYWEIRLCKKKKPQGLFITA